MPKSVQDGLKKAGVLASNAKASLIVTGSMAVTTAASAAALPAPDMADATGSVTNVFGAVLGVAVLIFGFKKVKSLLWYLEGFLPLCKFKKA